jgi:hypothetical protein
MADTLGPKGKVFVPRCSQIGEGYLTYALGVKQAATNRYNIFRRNWGTLTPLDPKGVRECQHAEQRTEVL